MEKNNIFVAIAGFVITIIFLLLAYFNYKTNVSLTIYTTHESVAKHYAKSHFLETVIVPNSEMEQYSKKIEEFSYMEKDNTLTLTKYKGISKKLVIPKKINGKKVIAIAKEFFEENQNFETIVISENITSFGLDERKEINIECFSGEYCEELKEKGWNVTILNDSDYVDFNNQDSNFSYELKDGTIELIHYQGKDQMAIVPSHINGYEVTKLSFDSSSISTIYIPSTVKGISESFLSFSKSRTFLMIEGTSILAYLIFLFLVLTNKKGNLEHKSNITILYLISITYLIVIGFFVKNISNSLSGNQTFLLQVIITTLIYICVAITLKVAIKNSESFEEKLKKKTQFINESLLLLETLDKEDKYELKEIFHYSDSVSLKLVEGIEQEITNLLNNINQENADKIKKLMKKRNVILKQQK